MGYKIRLLVRKLRRWTPQLSRARALKRHNSSYSPAKASSSRIHSFSVNLPVNVSVTMKHQKFCIFEEASDGSNKVLEVSNLNSESGQNGIEQLKSAAFCPLTPLLDSSSEPLAPHSTIVQLSMFMRLNWTPSKVFWNYWVSCIYHDSWIDIISIHLSNI